MKLGLHSNLLSLSSALRIWHHHTEEVIECSKIVAVRSLLLRYC